MQFAIVSRGDARSAEIARELTDKLTKADHTESIAPRIVVSVGGDGTMLQAFHEYSDRLNDVLLVGIHTGHLGFYADWQPDELDELTDMITSEAFEPVSYPLVEVLIDYEDGTTERHLAMNECTIKNYKRTLVCDLSIRDDYFETFRGDGLCISTPSGSTAYNKALGGAIVHPSIEAIQVAEMASINNLVYRTIGSPLLLPKHHQVKIEPHTKTEFELAFDHQEAGSWSNVRSLRCAVAKEKVTFARFRPFPFWRRVRESFIEEGK
ncbi:MULTISPECIES: NAD kinase [Exiguobacterium]|uniref:NAD kinase n=1 Tax=Exiguobacterium TaxID=33986 RepID=UPI001BE62BA1|nr:MULTISPECIES: NAD kinase [Exiguobacterium]MCT4781896.1 NAD kinase [Exiguobacterium himgiriensis]